MTPGKASDVIQASSDISLVGSEVPNSPRERSPRTAYALIHDELLLDGNSRQNLATFCTTWIEPEALTLMAECIDKNMCDKDEYPQTAEIESRCVHILADLWNSPDGANTIGCSTTGSSEAAMLGGLAAKWRWRAKMRAQGKSTDKPNLVCGPVQVCWHKFGRYFDVEVREVPVEGDRLLMGPEQALARCDENTIMVVPTLGRDDVLPVRAGSRLSRMRSTISRRDTGLDIPIHVDAASGGFLAPFCQPDIAWDFRLPRVKSINTSGHKFGLAPLGVGWVVWRDRADLPEDLIFHVNYLGGDMPTFALNFSRPAGQIVCQYYNFLRLGFEGYQKDPERLLSHRAASRGRDRQDGAVPHHSRRPWRTARGLLGAARGQGLRLHAVRSFRSAARARMAGTGLLDAAESRGSRRPADTSAPRRKSATLATCCWKTFAVRWRLLEKHPISHPLTENEAGGYNHN